MNTNWTAAITGMSSRYGVTSVRENSMIATSGMSPNANPTTPATVAAVGRTILGKAICLMSWSWLDHGRRRVGHRCGEPLPGQDRREDEERVVLDALPARDERDEHDVDDHLEERIEDPPEVPEERVRAALLHVGLDEIADQPLA